MPVSATVTFRHSPESGDFDPGAPCPFGWFQRVAVTVTRPLSGVNLMALLRRLYMICLNFASSANSSGGAAATSKSRAMPFLLASVLTIACTFCSARATLNELRVSSSLAGLDLGEVEDVVDQLQQVAAAVEDVVGVLELPVVQVAKGLVAEDLGEADDGIERGAQLVAHAGEELALGAVGGLGGVLGLLQRLLHPLALRDF